MVVTDSLVETTRPGGENRNGSAGDADEAALIAVLDALGDAVSRQILVAAAGTVAGVDALSERCGVSNSTVYRRLDRLESLGLVERVDRPVAGTSGYRTTMRGLYVAVDAEGLTVAYDEGATADELATAFGIVCDAVSIDRVEYDREAGAVELRLTLGDGDFETLFGLCAER